MKVQYLAGLLWGVVMVGGVATLSFAEEPVKPSPSSDMTKPGAPMASALTLPANAGEKQLASSVQLSTGALDIQRLTQAGIGEAVILAYITNSTSFYGLTPEAIIYLHNIGTSPRIISAMIAHDEVLSTVPPASLYAAAPAQGLAVLVPEAEGSTIIANDDAWPAPSIIADDEGYAPEQPASLGPVRAPYPVRLNDPIVIMKLPSFTIPYW